MLRAKSKEPFLNANQSNKLVLHARICIPLFSCSPRGIPRCPCYMYKASLEFERLSGVLTIIPVLFFLKSLYSTATQNYWRWCFALGQPHNAKICVGNTNMLVSKNAKICVIPNAKPQRESVGCRLRWVPNATFLPWPC